MFTLPLDAHHKVTTTVAEFRAAVCNVFDLKDPRRLYLRCGGVPINEFHISEDDKTYHGDMDFYLRVFEGRILTIKPTAKGFEGLPPVVAIPVKAFVDIKYPYPRMPTRRELDTQKQLRNTLYQELERMRNEVTKAKRDQNRRLNELAEEEEILRRQENLPEAMQSMSEESYESEEHTASPQMDGDYNAEMVVTNELLGDDEDHHEDSPTASQQDAIDIRAAGVAKEGDSDDDNGEARSGSGAAIADGDSDSVGTNVGETNVAETDVASDAEGDDNNAKDLDLYGGSDKDKADDEIKIDINVNTPSLDNDDIEVNDLENPKEDSDESKDGKK